MTKQKIQEGAEQYAEGKSSSIVFQQAHIKDFKSGANWALENRWVKCSDRMPDEENNYLVVISNEVCCRFFEKGRFYNTEFSMDITDLVTDWTYLPTPPKH